MKKVFTALTTLIFVVLLISVDVLADETRAQFEGSSRAKATSGLYRDAWDNFIEFPWFLGKLEKGNYLWTNLANLQSDNLPNNVNTNYQDTYSWSKDEKEDILGTPASWDSNNSYALGYAGNPVGSEGWNLGIVYNYQTLDSKTTADTPSGTGTYSTLNNQELLEHHWLMGGGFSVSEELKLGFAWYHNYNDQKLDSSSDTYDDDGNVNAENSTDYALKDQIETLSFGAYYQLNEDLAIAGYLDIDYNLTKVDQDTSVVTPNSVDDYEGTRNNTFYGNVDAKDFGFDLLGEVIKSWNGDFWNRTEFYLNLGYHPEDGDYTGSHDTRTLSGSSWNYYKDYDVDGDINWDEFNWSVEARSYINFGEKVHFAWAAYFGWYDVEQDFNYDRVTNPNSNNSYTSSINDNADYRTYTWSFPVALEIDFVKNLTGRLGARWNLSDYSGEYDSESGSGDDDVVAFPTTYKSSTDSDSKTSSTSYSFGLGWRFNEYLQIDLTDFTDLTDMNDWQLSCTLMW